MGWILILNLICLIPATCRLTEAIVIDKIGNPLRRLYPSLFSCGRCVSFWTATITLLSMFYVPWLNWVLALSWVTLFIYGRGVKETIVDLEGRSFNVRLLDSGKIVVDKCDFDTAELAQLTGTIIRNSWRDKSASGE